MVDQNISEKGGLWVHLVCAIGSFAISQEIILKYFSAQYWTLQNCMQLYTIESFPIKSNVWRIFSKNFGSSSSHCIWQIGKIQDPRLRQKNEKDWNNGQIFKRNQCNQIFSLSLIIFTQIFAKQITVMVRHHMPHLGEQIYLVGRVETEWDAQMLEAAAAARLKKGGASLPVQQQLAIDRASSAEADWRRTTSLTLNPPNHTIHPIHAGFLKAGAEKTKKSR